MLVVVNERMNTAHDRHEKKGKCQKHGIQTRPIRSRTFFAAFRSPFSLSDFISSLFHVFLSCFWSA